jgi:hypothetical protein
MAALYASGSRFPCWGYSSNETSRPLYASHMFFWRCSPRQSVRPILLVLLAPKLTHGWQGTCLLIRPPLTACQPSLVSSSRTMSGPPRPLFYPTWRHPRLRSRSCTPPCPPGKGVSSDCNTEAQLRDKTHHQNLKERCHGFWVVYLFCIGTPKKCVLKRTRPLDYTL